MTVQASAPSPASSAEPAGRATALTFVKERGRLGGIGVVLIAYLLFSNWVAHGTLFTQSLIIDAAIFAILAVSVDIVAGMTGLYSLGHAGLFALGAYTTTLLHNDHGISVFLLLPISIVGVGLVGLVLGALSLRVTGLYFAITTFIFTLVVAVMASDFSFTGGEQGLVGPEFPHFGAALSGLGSAIVWAVMLALLLVVLITLGLRRSPLYPIMLRHRLVPSGSVMGQHPPLAKIAASLAGVFLKSCPVLTGQPTDANGSPGKLERNNV